MTPFAGFWLAVGMVFSALIVIIGAVSVLDSCRKTFEKVLTRYLDEMRATRRQNDKNQ